MNIEGIRLRYENVEAWVRIEVEEEEGMGGEMVGRWRRG